HPDCHIQILILQMHLLHEVVDVRNNLLISTSPQYNPSTTNVIFPKILYQTTVCRGLAKQHVDRLLRAVRLELDKIAYRAAAALTRQKLHIDDIPHGAMPWIILGTYMRTWSRSRCVRQFSERIACCFPVCVERRNVRQSSYAETAKLFCVTVEDGRVSFRRVKICEARSSFVDCALLQRRALAHVEFKRLDTAVYRAVY